MSWARNLPKTQRQELRRIAGLGHERALATALAALEEQFRLWRSGQLGPHDLSDAIHQFHQGPSRRLWLQYQDGPVEYAALHALHSGVVSESEVAPDILQFLKPLLELFEPRPGQD